MWAIGGTQPDWRSLRRYARRAEELGFDSIWVCDDAMYKLAGRQLGILGCIATAGALCATTERIIVGTLVANAHTRSPALLAKEADTLAIVSDGRFVLGLGAGDDRAQHEALGIVWDGRFGAYEEAVKIIAGLLRDGRVDFAGEHHRARNAELVPRGPEPGGPRLLVGGKGPRMMRIAAENADIWNAFFAWRGGDLAPLLTRLDAACEKAGRDPESLARSVSISAAFGDHPVLVGDRDMGDIGVRGTPERIAQELADLADLGVAEVQVQTAPFDIEGLELLAEARALLPSAG